MILSIRVALSRDELIVNNQLPEALWVMSLPILDSGDELLRRRGVLLLSRGLVDLVGDPFNAGESRDDRKVVFVVVGSGSLDERLIKQARDGSESAEDAKRAEEDTHAQEQRILGDPLDRLDEEGRKLSSRLKNQVEIRTSL